MSQAAGLVSNREPASRSGWSRLILSLLATVGLVAGMQLAAQPARAAADTCAWTGAVSADWGDGANWALCDNGGVPESGDTLLFTSAGLNRDMNNDLVGLAIQQFVVQSDGVLYTVDGNPFTVIQNLTVQEYTEVKAPITLGDGSNYPTLRALSPAWLELSGQVTMANTRAIVGDAGYTGTVEFHGNIVGSGGLIADLGATAAVRGASNTFTGTLVGASRDGVYACRSGTCFGDAGNGVFLDDGVIELRNAGTYANPVSIHSGTSGSPLLDAYTDVTLNGALTATGAFEARASLTGSTLQIAGSIANAAGITLSGIDSNAGVTLSGQVSGAGGIVAASGSHLLSGTSVFDGQVIVAADAVLTVSSADALGSLAQATTVDAGGALVFGALSAVIVPEAFVLSGAGTLAHPGAIVNRSTAEVTLAGDILLAGDTTIANAAGADDLVIEGVISETGGSRSLTLYGGVDGYNDPGIELGGSSPNTYTGTTTGTGGALYAMKTGAIPGDLTLASDTGSGSRVLVYVYGTNAIADTGVVTLTTIEDNISFGNITTQEIIGGLVGAAGQVSFANAGVGFVIDQDIDSTYAGDWYSDGLVATVTKRGSGTLTLSGTDIFMPDRIDYVVEAGGLVVDGNLRTTNAGNVMVRTGATLRGTGTIGAATIDSGATLAPGNSPGTLNVTALTLAADGIHQAELASAASYDRVIATGTATLTGTLLLQPTYMATVGTVFTIIQAGAVSGTYAGLADGAVATAEGQRFRIHYTATAVTLEVLQAVLPATGADALPTLALGAILLLVGTGGAIAGRPRRRMVR